MGHSEQAWQRLAEAVKSRRDELRLTQTDVAVAGEISVDRVRAVETLRGHEQLRRKTMRGLAIGLGWTPESVEVILAGGDPTPAHSLAPPTADIVYPQIRLGPSRQDRPAWLDLVVPRDILDDPSRMEPDQAMRVLETWRWQAEERGAGFFWDNLRLLLEARDKMLREAGKRAV